MQRVFHVEDVRLHDCSIPYLPGTLRGVDAKDVAADASEDALMGFLHRYNAALVTLLVVLIHYSVEQRERKHFAVYLRWGRRGLRTSRRVRLTTSSLDEPRPSECFVLLAPKNPLLEIQVVSNLCFQTARHYSRIAADESADAAAGDSSHSVGQEGRRRLQS